MRPGTDEGFALILPEATTETMSVFLEEFAKTIPDNVHVAMLLDQAGWHGAKALRVPEKITLVPLPPYSPELNPAEPVWLYMRNRFLSFRVYSGLDAESQRRQQFLFSSMGLNVQALLDEAILDVPHRGGGPFERGVLAGGIATALFYVTIGRTASVSDVDFMARTSSLSKGDITLIYGGVALMHAVRIHYDGRYANFFVRPAPSGEPGLRVGVHVR